MTKDVSLRGTKWLPPLDGIELPIESNQSGAHRNSKCRHEELDQRAPRTKRPCTGANLVSSLLELVPLKGMLKAGCRGVLIRLEVLGIDKITGLVASHLWRDLLDMFCRRRSGVGGRVSWGYRGRVIFFLSRFYCIGFLS